jgi:anaerobic magnesium-protoporphyrin IX monomethyl ester cyclase
MRILLIVYDNDSFVHTFPLGLAYIASALRNAGFHVEIYNQDVNHYPESHLTDYLNHNRFDMVGIGVIGGYYQYGKLLKISEAIARSVNRPEYYVLGGHGPSPEPEYFLNKTGADIVVIGEGEETIVDLVKSISNKESLVNVLGIAYRNSGEVVVNPRRELLQDIDGIPWPAYDLFPIEYYRLIRFPHAANSDFCMPMLSARGCPFSCNFCYRMDKGYRIRDPEKILDEIQYLHKEYGITYIEFTDDLLMSSTERVVSICECFLSTGLQVKWNCNGRLNYAKPHVLRLMKRAGCVFINYGIEAFDNRILKNMNKALTTGQIIKGIKATLAEGISPGFNLIFGNIGEDEKTLEKGVNFLLKYDDGAQLRTIRPVTPYPGSPLYYHAIEKGLLAGVEDFYENKHVNSDLLAVNFTQLSDDEFHRCLMEANLTLLENYYRNKKESILEITRNLYMHRDVEFRGYRQS